MFGKKQLTESSRQRPQKFPEQRSSVVFSYHANNRAVRLGNLSSRDARGQQKEAEKSPAAKRRKRHGNWLKRTPTIAGLLLVGFLLLNSLFMSTSPKVVQDTQANANGSSQRLLRPIKVYQQAAAIALGGSPFNHLKFVVNTQRITQNMKAQFPELAQVTLTLPLFGHQPVVHITPATPAALLSTTGGASYVLDLNGRAIIAATQAAGISNAGLPIITDQSGLGIALGHVALPSTTVGFIREVTGQMQTAHLAIASLTLPKGTSELDVRLSGLGYYVKYNIKGNAKVEAGGYLAVKKQLEKDHKTPDSYVDMRVEGRAFYK